MRIGFNPNIQMKPPIDPKIKTQLDELGLKPTGTKEGDLAAIQDALLKKAQETSGLQQNGDCPPPQTPEEIAKFMRSIGLQPTNSKEGDDIAIRSKLNEMEVKATSQAELNTVESLRSTFAQLIASASSGGSSFQGQSTTCDSLAGQDQVAKLNKWFLLKSIS